MRTMRARSIVQSGLLAAVVVVGVLLSFPTSASAHPLGNFTVNRYARIETTSSVIRVIYVLDEAEIPTFQDQPDFDANPDKFVDSRVAQIRNGLTMTVDGKPAALEVKQRVYAQPAGQSGLKTLRLVALFETQLPSHANPQKLEFADANEPDRIGWREIVTKATGNSTIASSSVPTKDISNELRAYPKNLIQAPLNERSASMIFDPGAVTPPPPPLNDGLQLATTGRANDGFGNLVGKTTLTLGGVVLALALAFVFGAGHALGPGHGKSVMAAYLVGTRGRPIDAVWLGLIVALMHTGSVLILGFGLLLLNTTTDLSRLYPVLTVLSGVVVLLFGAVLGQSRLRSLLAVRRQSAAHQHVHQHEHDHEHSHGFGSHSHAIPAGVAPLSRKGLFVLAASGGLLPSPSAIIVLVSSASLGRLPFGLVLVGVFSVGLAATLSAVGVSLVYGRNFLSRHFLSKHIDTSAFVNVLPVLSSAALVILGSIVIAHGIETY